MRYEDAGVSFQRAEDFLKQLKDRINLKSFGGLFPFKDTLSSYREPVLVASTDGIGTKIKLALQEHRLEGLGQDLVAMVCNDLVTLGARPLFFLDYFAVARLEPDRHRVLLQGLLQALEEIDCVLLGGETAELPGLFASPIDFDLAGFGVGVVERSRIPDPEHIQPGDRLIGLVSSGPHANGFSLIRKVLDHHPELRSQRLENGQGMLDWLLTPTRLYVQPVLRAFETGKVKGAAHITGGGIPENLPRILNDGVDAAINRSAIPTPRGFRLLQEVGNIPEDEMWRVFNMGIGFVLVVAPEDLAEVLQALEGGTVIGTVVEGHGGIQWR